MPLPEPTHKLRAMFRAAFDFGLSEEEIWQTIQGVVEETPPDRPAGESIDAVADALAQKIEQKRGE